MDNFFNRARSLVGKLKNKIVGGANAAKRTPPPENTLGLKHRDFTPQQQKAKQFLIDNDRKTWENDYNRFLQACDDITYFLKEARAQVREIAKAEKRKDKNERAKINPTVTPN